MENNQKERPELDPDFWEKSFGNPMQLTESIFAEYNTRYSTSTPIEAWHTLQLGTDTTQIEAHTLLLSAQTHQLALTAFNGNVLRVRLTQDASTKHFSYAILPTLQPETAITLTEKNSEFITFTFGDYTAQISLQNAHLTIRKATKNIYQEQVGISYTPSGHTALSLHMHPQEVVLGTGQRTFDLNLRGRKLNLWNTDAGSYQRGFEPINYCVPFTVHATPNGCYGVFFDNTHRGTIDIGASETDILRWQFEGGEACYYVLIGERVEDVLKQFATLTGTMPLPPLWTLGHHQARYSYFDQDEVLATAKTMRAKNIPCDAIYLDIHYMDGFRVFTWDKQAFPNLPELVRQLHKQNIKLVVILDPGVKVDETYTAYTDGVAKGIFMTMPDSKPVTGVVWPGLCYHPDFTNPKARIWWQEQLIPLLQTGVDGVWNDMNEPLYFSSEGAISPPDYVVHDKEGIGGTHLELHNTYGHLMAESSYNALKAHRPTKRPFNFTRSGYAGTQRHASSWTGDNTATWDTLRVAIPMNLNMGLSGQSFTGPDIGGFAKDTDGELITRWYQACVLFPYYRNHSAIDTTPQEAWRFGETYETLMRQAIETRYRFLPSLYTAFAECHLSGTPIIRPVFTLENSPASFVYHIDDSYALGDNLLIAPILNPHTLRRNVYLPKGQDWYNFWTNERYTGGQFISIEAPLDIIPIFVRGGTVLHIAKVAQHLAEYPLIEQIVVYKGTGTTRYYEDTGEGYDYTSGVYRWITYEVSDNGAYTRTITGNYSGQDLEGVLVKMIG